MHTIVQAVLQVRQLDQLRQGHMLMRPLLRATLQQEPQPMCTRLSGYTAAQAAGPAVAGPHVRRRSAALKAARALPLAHTL